MKQVPIRLGPLALLLTVVAICMTVLALLTFSTARADLAMAQKLAASTQERYELEAEGQTFLRDLAGELHESAGQLEYLLDADAKTDPKGLPRYSEPEALKKLDKDEDGCYWKTLERDGLTLSIGLEWSPKTDALEVACWPYSSDWQAPEEIGGLWPGQ